MNRTLAIEQINKSLNLWIKTGDDSHKSDFKYFLNQIKKGRAATRPNT